MESNKNIVKLGMTDRFLDYYEKRIKDDREAAFFVFLAVLSKDTEQPQNIFMKGKSGIGKTYITTEVLDLFSEQDVWFLGGLSPTALVHDRGVLVDERGNEVDLSLKPTKEQIKFDLELEHPDQHIDKRRVYKEYFEQRKQWDEKLKDSYYRVDLHGKILVFLDAPHPETFARLLPVLSHDKEEISYKFTDKTSQGQLRTSHVKIYGWPATIFCSTKEKWIHDFSTRSFTITPRTTENKLRSALCLIGRNFSFPKKLEGKEHLKLVSILASLETKLREKNLKALVPYGECLGKIVPIYRERVMRDYKHILGYIGLNALLNMSNRPVLKVGDESYVLAVKEDFEKILTMFQYCEKTTLTGLSYHVIDVFERVMKPLGVFSYSTLVQQSKEVLDYPLSSSTFYVYVRELAKIGWVDEEPDPEDKRKKIISVILKEKNLLSSLTKRFGTFFKLENWKEWLNGIKELSYEKSELLIENLPVDQWDNGTEEIFNKYYYVSEEEKNALEKTKGLSNNLKSSEQPSSSQPSLLPVGNILLRQSKIIQNLKALTRLTSHFEGKCVVCDFQGQMDWQATKIDGTWALLCDKCGLILEKKFAEVE